MARESQLELNSPMLSSDDEEDASDSESESLPNPPPADSNPELKSVPTTTATPNPPPAVAGEDSESDSDSDYDSESGDQAVVKPAASNPKEFVKPKSLATNSTKAGASIVAKTEAGLKRRAAEIGLNDSKRAVKKVAVQVQVEGDSEKKDPEKKLFQRLFSDEDEIVILKGIMEFVEKNSVDRVSDMKAFLDSIHKSLHVEVNTSQLQDKMRRLKKKFKNNARKVKPGKEKVFTKPHENEVFALSKKIWAPDGKLLGIESSKPNAPTRKNKPNQMPAKSVLSPQLCNLANGGQNGFFSHLMLPIKLYPGRTVGDRTVEEDILVDGWKYIEGSKKLELEEKWRKLYVQEMELSLKRAALIKDHTALVLEGVKAKGI